MTKKNVLHLSENITYQMDGGSLSVAQVANLYRAVGWSAAGDPVRLLKALAASHSLVCAYAEQDLIGVGNAISDGYLVVYYPHLLVHPDYQRFGIGTEIAQRLLQEYAGFHQQVLMSDQHSVAFHQRMGFVRPKSAAPLWIYSGKDHD